MSAVSWATKDEGEGNVEKEEEEEMEEKRPNLLDWV
jgi:hypothetical protein